MLELPPQAFVWRDFRVIRRREDIEITGPGGETAVYPAKEYLHDFNYGHGLPGIVRGYTGCIEFFPRRGPVIATIEIQENHGAARAFLLLRRTWYAQYNQDDFTAYGFVLDNTES